MARENFASKAMRLLQEGRVSIFKVENGRVEAVVRGDSARLYRVIFDGVRWSCDCEAKGRCSHGFATQQVVLIEPPWFMEPLPLVGATA
jgi:uncharacterized Zn finger protein